ncbi:hypothetical protein TNIN_439811 [Trichonephila inaurata madagascariensis]|uniref:Transmembrane protein n=1 Tax=Trichonephila inaurata madagascariensis TaxID=2747483 RepID=A0A8X6YIL3_9ARAC|nr:hypothetical protein TNIN_439811 [Trichonephila inaurata madagascariensis]
MNEIGGQFPIILGLEFYLSSSWRIYLEETGVLAIVRSALFWTLDIVYGGCWLLIPRSSSRREVRGGDTAYIRKVYFLTKVWIFFRRGLLVRRISSRIFLLFDQSEVCM